MKVAIYIRVSTRLQEDKFSLSSQKIELEKYANEKGWEIVDIFKDVESGGTLDKIGLNTLMECVEDGLVDVVLCMDQDRLSRLDTIEWELLKQTLRENGVKIAEPGVLTDLTNENDEFISDIKNLIAKKEKRTVVRRMMRGLRQYVREGNFYGKLPHFYKFDKVTKVISVDEEFSWIVNFIDEAYLNERVGFTTIANRLNEITLSPKGKRYSGVTVLNILKNKAYHGELVREFKNYEPITVDDVFPKLRTKETYLRIQHEMSKRHKKRSEATPHFLRDITIKCAHCGYVLGIQTGSTKIDGKYAYFMQHSTFKRFHANCYINTYVNTTRIYKPLLKKMKTLLEKDKIAADFMQYKNEPKDVENLKTRIIIAQKNQNKLQTKLDNLIDLYLDGSFDKTKLKKRKEKIEIDIQINQDDLKRLQKQLEAITKNQITHDAILSYFSIASTIDFLNESDLQGVLGDLFSGATYDFEKEELTLHTSINNIQLDVRIELIDSQQIHLDRLAEVSKKRYKKYKKIIAANPNCSQKQLVKLSGYNADTVRKDLERFGRPKGLKRKKNDPQLKIERMNGMKEMLKVNNSFTASEMARVLQMDAGTARRYLEEIRRGM